jgi:hypothetical protein
MSILKEINSDNWTSSFSSEINQDAVNAIEQGCILHLPKLAFELLSTEKEFLSPAFAEPKAKNISLNHSTQLLRCAHCSIEQYNRLKIMLQRFSEYATQLVHTLLVPYKNELQLGRTSFRPVEIAGRASSYRKDDTRLHVDAFPATPNQGRRILRVFTNINPEGQARHWRVGESFSEVVTRFLSLTSKQWPGSAALLKWLGITKSKRTAYDHLMLQIHDKMKADLHYQKTVSQQSIYFAPGSSWIVQTDHVSHAAMSGQHVLEQTFYLPVQAMVNPALSPLRILEKFTGRVLT